MTLSAAILLFVLSMLGLAEMTLATTSLRLANRRMYDQKALNLAMAGADEAQAQFAANGSFMSPGQTWSYTVGGSDGGTVTLTCASNGGYTQVTSVGTVTGALGSIAARIRVGVPRSGSVPPFLYGVSAENNMTISGGASVLSSPTAGQGNVYTNGNLTVAGTTTRVDGSASAVGTVTQSSGTITGTVTAGAPPLTFPDIDQSFKNLSLTNGVTIGSVTLNGGSGQIMKGEYSGNVTVGSNGCTILDGSVVWITGALALSGPIRGTGTVVVDGQITVSGHSFSSTTNVLFISTYPRTATNPTGTAPTTDAIALSGGSTVYGYFYAPYAQLSLSGGTDVFGGISALAISISGGGTITLPDDGRTKPPAPVTSTPGWEEF